MANTGLPSFGLPKLLQNKNKTETTASSADLPSPLFHTTFDKLSLGDMAFF
jgi:hypothetical protein